MYNTTAAYQPKRRGPASKKSARALVSVLAGYWVKQLGRDFTQYWVGKDKDGIPVPASAASQFVLDVAGMINIDVRDVPALKRACAEQVATLRKKAPGGRNS